MSKPESRTLVCDSCGYQIVENRGIKADDPCPDCEQGGMMPLNRESSPAPDAPSRNVKVECAACKTPYISSEPLKDTRCPVCGGHVFNLISAAAPRVVAECFTCQPSIDQAIPPCYTEFIGKQLLRHLESV